MKNTPENYARMSRAITAALTKAQAFKSGDPATLLRWTHNEVMNAVYPMAAGPEDLPDEKEIIRRGEEIARVFRIKKSKLTGFYGTTHGSQTASGVFNIARQLTQ